MANQDPDDPEAKAQAMLDSGAREAFAALQAEIPGATGPLLRKAAVLRDGPRPAEPSERQEHLEIQLRTHPVARPATARVRIKSQDRRVTAPSQRKREELGLPLASEVDAPEEGFASVPLGLTPGGRTAKLPTLGDLSPDDTTVVPVPPRRRAGGLWWVGGAVLGMLVMGVVALQSKDAGRAAEIPTQSAKARGANSAATTNGGDPSTPDTASAQDTATTSGAATVARSAGPTAAVEAVAATARTSAAASAHSAPVEPSSTGSTATMAPQVGSVSTPTTAAATAAPSASSKKGSWFRK